MAGHHDPRLLYSISGIRAYFLQNGEEQPLTPSGAQTLSLLMVPTNSPFADLSSTQGTDTAAPEEDFYLHLNLPPELDLALPATTQIYHQPPRSYLIPRWDLGPESGAFTRIEFPKIGYGPEQCSQEDVDTFETILAQCTAFLERAQPPMPSSKEKSGYTSEKGYNPAAFKPGEGYAHGTGSSSHGHIVLVDEENGSVMGEMTQGPDMIDDSKITPGYKGILLTLISPSFAQYAYCHVYTDPVEIQITPDGKRIIISPISDDYLRMANHPAYQNSSIVQNAAAASRLIVTGSSYLSNLMTTGAEGFTAKTKPAAKPMTFTETAHVRVRKINSATTSIAGISAKTVGKVTDYAQNVSAKMVGKGERERRAGGKEVKPGVLNKSMIAFSTVMDGIATSGKHLLTSGGAAASTVVGHRWGPEAGNIAAELAGGVKNVGLVYIVSSPLFPSFLPVLGADYSMYPGRNRRLPARHHQIRRQGHDCWQSEDQRWRRRYRRRRWRWRCCTHQRPT
jgi:spartin